MSGPLSGFTYDAKKHIAKFSLYQPNTNGKIRRERTVRAQSKDEAIRLWQEFRAELRAAASAQATQKPTSAACLTITFGAFVETYLKQALARKAKKTLTTYKTIATTRLVPFFGEVSLDAIQACDVDAFVANTLASGCTPAYTNNCIRTLKALLGHAVRFRLIEATPLREKIEFEHVDLPELELTDAERVAFLAAFDDEEAFRRDIGDRRAQGHEVASAHFASSRAFGFGLDPESDSATRLFERFRTLKPIFLVALETGLRKSDLLNLEWQQVKLLEGFIRVRMRKTKKFAVIPISDLCRSALDDCQRRRTGSPYVFATHDGKPLSETTLRRAFVRVKRLAGITRRFRFHDLRHSAACAYANASVPLQVIQNILGHQSIKMTERYARVDDAAIGAAALAMNARNARLGLTCDTRSHATVAGAPA